MVKSLQIFIPINLLHICSIQKESKKSTLLIVLHMFLNALNASEIYFCDTCIYRLYIGSVRESDLL